MLNMKDCKELNWFDHYEILNSYEQNKINKTINMINNCNSFKAVDIKNNEYYYILHRCTKESGYQMSFFKGLTAVSDIFRNSINDIAKEIVNYNNYKICEVI